jgi:5-methylcytosine-specific restriction endonuclease McrA
VADAAEPVSPARAETNACGGNLAGIRLPSGAERGTEPAQRLARPVDGLGEDEVDAGDALQAEAAAPRGLRRLRLADAVRLLNSTPLGEVIGDRQVRRHRVESEGAFWHGRRIDLVAYAAWLAKRFSIEKDRSNGSVSVGNVLALVERQGFRCALTGRKLEPATAALDHVVPLTQGGQHRIENTQVLHKEVNRAKGVLTNERFVALCREVAAWADARKTDHN